jgi:hypothetical protein
MEQHFAINALHTELEREERRGERGGTVIQSKGYFNNGINGVGLFCIDKFVDPLSLENEIVGARHDFVPLWNPYGRTDGEGRERTKDPFRTTRTISC